MKKLTVLFAALLTISNAAASDNLENPIDISNVPIEELLQTNIHIGMFSSRKIFKIPSMITVVDRATIERYGIRSISEALSLVPGFTVYRTYLKNHLPTARGVLQTHYANKILVMINGVPTWHASTGEPNIDRIDIEDVERIEVLKGPASVIYGTNAYSGAINIVLRKYSPSNRMNIRMESGSEYTITAAANTFYKNKEHDIELAFYGGGSKERGDRRGITDETGKWGKIDDSVDIHHFTFTGRIKGHSLLFNTYHLEETTFGVVPKFSSGLGEPAVSDGYLINYTYTGDQDRISYKIGGTFDWNRRRFSRAEGGSIKADVEGYRLLSMGRISAKLLNWLSAEGGADFEFRYSQAYRNFVPIEETVLDENNMKGKNVREISGYAQLEANLGRWTAVGGSRITNNEFFGTNVSSRFTLLFEINNKNVIKLNYGESFRAPSLFEMYFTPSSMTIFGSENLNPEKSRAVELAWLSQTKGLYLNILGYWAWYDDKIFRIKGDAVLSGTTYHDVNIYANASPFQAVGAEAEIRWDNKILDTFASYSAVMGNHGDEENNDKNFNYYFVPVHSFVIGAHKAIGPFAASSMLHFTGPCNGPHERIGAQAWADFHLSYTHKINDIKIEHSFSAKNTFDEDTSVPEYVRRNLNEIPLGPGQRFLYTIRVHY